MSLQRTYTYYDYEMAYFHMQYNKCKDIGLYLLSRLKDKKSKELLEKLKKYKYQWDKPQEATLLEEVKIWLYVTQSNY